ncbi:expressed protein [Batrachochytrium dendrobatidis JAM81]|uniref:Nuclear pore complex protein Nup153 n=1 Tax=Batrachochytrium dendrobatidis (strain JAM81 / FGSC 10211) TaxID=684364 RepID=F4P4D3_BATDJ|nr:uncharacterized protein BATDEDRAFT_35229 [Batrachochytrium dendrobatidis JAM81]EGF79902.1 expressed protein [Batrachochytrium dendrobatidis JAM81]|eukprot:XP_006679550.1 expressed protein [Batrachochytrium dendrobatidis JAM81]
MNTPHSPSVSNKETPTGLYTNRNKGYLNTAGTSTPYKKPSTDKRHQRSLSRKNESGFSRLFSPALQFLGVVGSKNASNSDKDSNDDDMQMDNIKSLDTQHTSNYAENMKNSMLKRELDRPATSNSVQDASPNVSLAPHSSIPNQLSGESDSHSTIKFGNELETEKPFTFSFNAPQGSANPFLVLESGANDGQTIPTQPQSRFPTNSQSGSHRSISPALMAGNEQLLNFLNSKRGQPLTDKEIEACRNILDSSIAQDAQLQQSSEPKHYPLFSRSLFSLAKAYPDQGPGSSTSSARSSISKVRISRRPVRYAGSGFGASRGRTGTSMWKFQPTNAPGTPKTATAPLFQVKHCVEDIPHTPFTKRIKLGDPEKTQQSGPGLQPFVPIPFTGAASELTSAQVQKPKLYPSKRGLTSAAQSILSSLDDFDAPPTNVLMPFGMIKPLPNPYLASSKIQVDKQPKQPAFTTAPLTVDNNSSAPQNESITCLKPSAINSAKPLLLENTAPSFLPAVQTPKTELKPETLQQSISSKQSFSKDSSTFFVSKSSANTLVNPTSSTTSASAAISIPTFAPATISSATVSKPAIVSAATTRDSVYSKARNIVDKHLPHFSFSTQDSKLSEIPLLITELHEWDLIKKSAKEAGKTLMPTFVFDEKCAATILPTAFQSKPVVASSAKWECNICLVKNPSDKITCIACESPAPLKTATPAIPPKDPFGKWSCGVCLVKNPSDKITCIACESPAPLKTATPAIPPKDPFGKWSCGVCLVKNTADATTCIACTSARP